MLKELQEGSGADERNFLMSLVEGHPDWVLLGIAHLEHLPAIRWKLQNLTPLRQQGPKKCTEQIEALKRRLSQGMSP